MTIPVDFVRLALFYAWHVASGGGLKAQLLLGMNGDTADRVPRHHRQPAAGSGGDRGEAPVRQVERAARAFWSALTAAASRTDAGGAAAGSALTACSSPPPRGCRAQLRCANGRSRVQAAGGDDWRCGRGLARFSLRGSYASPSPSHSSPRPTKTASKRSRPSTLTSTRAISSRCWARTAPARPPPSASSPRWSTRPAASSRCSDTISTGNWKRPNPASAWCRRKSTSTCSRRCFTIVVNQAGFYGIPRPLAKQRAEKYLKQLQLWDRRNSIARSLSGGMKRRLMIARALMHEPKLLILDEPTAGVDIEIRRSMWEFLRNINDAGTTIILTTHYLEEAENLCRNVAIIEGGNIIERDSMANVLRKLQTEVFVFNLRDPRSRCAAIVGIHRRASDDHTLEIEMSKTQSLNDIFAQLSAQGIAVNSMRNKVNRLEELFIRLVDGSAADRAAQRDRSPQPARASRLARHRMDRLQNHHHPRIQPHRAHLGADDRAAGGHRDAVLHHLRQPDRPPGRPGGRLRLHAVHCARPHHDDGDPNSYGNVVSSFFGAKFGKHIEELLVSPLPNWLIVAGYIRAACCAACWWARW